VGDPRKLHVIITPSSGTPITISPDLSINAVPNSMVSDTVQGYTPIQLLTPVGTLISSLLTTCPSGYVLANGQSLLKTGYANLFAAIGTTYGSTTTTFDVPDTRGYFLRGLDTTGSVDTTAGRTLGSTEGQLTAVNGIRDTGHNHSATLYGLGGSGFQFTGQGAGGPGGTGYTSTNSANLIGDAETRPKNFAVNYCIKY
jgi:microcystin-dependent protein